MDPLGSRHLYKYFEPADRFVRVLIADPATSGPTPAAGMDGAAYREAVVRACIAECRGDLALLDAARGASREGALRALYDLVVDVNPAFDIRRVKLRGAEALRQTPASAPQRGARERLLRRARGLEARLAARVLGQDEALAAVARAVRRGAAGLSVAGRPLAALLFVGGTGTGKTELARALADELGGAGRESGLIRVDCSELAEGHEYAKLIGAPPGYVGHGEGGYLTEAIRRRPGSVVLFDEIEKGHARLHHLLLQLLEDGRLTDGAGKTVSFGDALVILTSNAGSSELLEARRGLGFARGELTSAATAEIAERALTRLFRPEFLGRLDETIVFRSLDPGDARRIAGLQLQALAARVRRSGRRVRVTTGVRDWVAARGFDGQSGARGIAHVIRREIEAPLAELLLQPHVGRGAWIHVTIRAGRPRLALELARAR